MDEKIKERIAMYIKFFVVVVVAIPLISFFAEMYKTNIRETLKNANERHNDQIPTQSVVQ